MVLHALAPVNARAAARLALPRRLPSAAGVVLTFDDGPHPEGTPLMLDLLARAGARAMFFVVGEQVVKRPSLIREIAAGGHQVALHGYRHRLQPRRSASAIQDDTTRGLAAVQDAIGAPVRYHRPPFGIYSPAGLAAAQSHGLQPLLWSRWGKDWRRLTTPLRIAARATRECSAGDVILLHDADFYSAAGSHQRTGQALELILTRLKAAELATVLPI